jgi:hypothetical protein
MPPFPDWLSQVLAGGASVQEHAPVLTAAERPRAVALLRAAFADHALDVAGPPLPFDEDAAVGAALLLAQACWCLVGNDDARPALRLDVPHSPPAALSADVALRFLPAVHRRARLRDPEGELVREIERILRAWPLSGVLADLSAGPATPPEFGGHAGLQLLYAERLAATGRPSWVPPPGPARDRAERVCLERGKPLPTPPKEEDRA